MEDLEDDKENRHESIDNKENIPVDISDEERENPSGNENSEDLRPTPTPLRNRRTVTPKTAGPSPMASKFSSPDISPDISPMVSRAGSPQPQPSKDSTSRDRRRRSIRRSFDKSSAANSSPRSRAQSRKSSTKSAAVPFTPRDSSPRGRSVSRSPQQSPSPSPSPLEKGEPLSDSLIDKLRTMLKPTIDTLSAIPLPTLLLIAIPFAGLIAFSINSYVQQRNLDFMVRSFMDGQVAREMHRLQEQTGLNFNPLPLEVQYIPAPPSILEEVIANAENMLPAFEPTFSVEDKADLEWREAQRKGLDHESVVYGVQVGGKCVMEEDVPAAIRKAASEREGTEHPEAIPEQPQNPIIDGLLSLEDDDDLALDFASVKPELDLDLEMEDDDDELDVPPVEAAPGSPKATSEDARGREEQRSQDDTFQKHERPGSRSPPLASGGRGRSRDRKSGPQQPVDYYHQPNKPVYDDYERMSEAGDIDVGKADVRDAGPDSWRDGDIPELELPPPIREIPASPSKVQPPVVEPSQQPVGSDESETAKSPYQNTQEPKNTPTDEGEVQESTVPVPGSTEGDATTDPTLRGEDESPEPIPRTGYTPQQRPQDYDSRPSSRDGQVDESDPAYRPESRDGRASSRPPSRSGSRRGSRSRSRPRSSGGSKGSAYSSGTMETVHEAETLAEQSPEETATAIHESSDPHSDEKASSNLPEHSESESEVEDQGGDESFFEKLGAKFGPQRIFGPMTKDPEAPSPATGDESTIATSATAAESTAIDQESEDNVSVGSASPMPSPALTSSEPSSEYDQYEDAEEDYDYDDQYEYQYDPDQYDDDYTYDSQDEYHNIPEELIDEDYAFEDEDADGSAYGEAEEFDYEKFKRSLLEDQN
ncbi:hypothetical protein TWF481_000208 [Arthrobotrys musiformis]|uniref:Uncharacterized protein n=1 Tax=Arthrobotrys musiformis TaxID=47236 RepID=A0AAV9WNZ0_9PEZI